MAEWYVYLLRCADETLYCGITNDLDRRLACHNAGKASKYTRVRTPVRLVASAAVGSKSEALKLEIRIKRLRRDAKIPFLKSLSTLPHEETT